MTKESGQKGVSGNVEDIALEEGLLANQEGDVGEDTLPKEGDVNELETSEQQETALLSKKT